mgnify:CR=1 FL=1
MRERVKIKTIRDKLQIMLPTSRFSLTLLNKCNDFRGVCDKDKEAGNEIATASTASSDDRLQFSEMAKFERCNYPIPIECNLEDYVDEDKDESCTRFIELRLNY